MGMPKWQKQGKSAAESRKAIEERRIVVNFEKGVYDLKDSLFLSPIF